MIMNDMLRIDVTLRFDAAKQDSLNGTVKQTELYIYLIKARSL
jgi:hypothetical protein